MDIMSIVREKLAETGKLPIEVKDIKETQDLYALGLTSFATVQWMLALEEAFDIEFPESMLNRRTFETLAALVACIQELSPSSSQI